MTESGNRDGSDVTRTPEGGGTTRTTVAPDTTTTITPATTTTTEPGQVRRVGPADPNPSAGKPPERPKK